MGGGYECLDENGTVRKFSNVVKGKNGKTASNEELTGFPWGKLYKSELFYNVSFPEGYWYEDSLMRQIVYPCASPIYGVEENVYCYRQNRFGITQSGGRKKKCIDSLWVTKQLYKDRQSLGIEQDQSYYEYILRMAKLTYLRTRHMPENIKQAVFIVFSDFIGTEFQGFQTHKNQDLEFALLNKKYRMYVKYCEK